MTLTFNTYLRSISHLVVSIYQLLGHMLFYFLKKSTVFTFSYRKSHPCCKIGHRRWLAAWNFGFRKKMDFSIQVAKTKALISCAVTHNKAQLFKYKYYRSRIARKSVNVVYTRFATNRLPIILISNTLKY